jgi:hypothetical protein
MIITRNIYPIIWIVGCPRCRCIRICISYKHKIRASSLAMNIAPLLVSTTPIIAVIEPNIWNIRTSQCICTAHDAHEHCNEKED